MRRARHGHCCSWARPGAGLAGAVGVPGAIVPVTKPLPQPPAPASAAAQLTGQELAARKAAHWLICITPFANELRQWHPPFFRLAFPPPAPSSYWTPMLLAYWFCRSPGWVFNWVAMGWPAPHLPRSVIGPPLSALPPIGLTAP